MEKESDSLQNRYDTYINTNYQQLMEAKSKSRVREGNRLHRHFSFVGCCSCIWVFSLLTCADLGSLLLRRWPKAGSAERKPRAEQNGKSLLDFDFQYEYGPRKRGLSILLSLRVSSKRCQKSYHRDNWLVAAKRS